MSMQAIHHLDSVPDAHVDDPEFKSPMMTSHLGALAGSQRIYVNVDYVKPGGKSVKYHSHSLQEEFFLVLKGSGQLRIDDRIVPVRAGDFFAKPAGQGIAHQFVNDGTEVLEILDCGTKDRGDVVEYPDEDVVLFKDQGIAVRGTEVLQDWSSDPNPQVTTPAGS